MAGTAGSAFEYDAEMADAQTPDLRSWQALNAPVQQHENTGGGLLTLRASWCLGSAEALSGSRAQFADLKQAVNMFRTSTQSLLDGRSGDAGGPSCACTHANAGTFAGIRDSQAHIKISPA